MGRHPASDFPSASIAPTRRDFLKGAAGGLVIAFSLPLRLGAAVPADATFAPNAFLRIAPDGTVTVICKHIEFGQGTFTGSATILADELDADWQKIKVEIRSGQRGALQQPPVRQGSGHRRLDGYGGILGSAAPGRRRGPCTAGCRRG